MAMSNMRISCYNWTSPVFRVSMQTYITFQVTLGWQTCQGSLGACVAAMVWRKRWLMWGESTLPHLVWANGWWKRLSQISPFWVHVQPWTGWTSIFSSYASSAFRWDLPYPAENQHIESYRHLEASINGATQTGCFFFNVKSQSKNDDLGVPLF